MSRDNLIGGARRSWSWSLRDITLRLKTLAITKRLETKQ